jgi:hypothetical protein
MAQEWRAYLQAKPRRQYRRGLCTTHRERICGLQAGFGAHVKDLFGPAIAGYHRTHGSSNCLMAEAAMKGLGGETLPIAPDKA